MGFSLGNEAARTIRVGRVEADAVLRNALVGAEGRYKMIRFLRVLAIGFGALLAAAPAHADCFDEAGKYQKVNPLILRAIAWQESHNTPDAMNKNANGSIDYGLMQINSVHLNTLSRYGISSTTLMEPCKSVYVAAWHLRQKMNKYGNSWQAVGAYHSETPALRDKYSQQIIGILGKWKLLQASR
jgi:soluble lytic murein transglycosylase-like protein